MQQNDADIIRNFNELLEAFSDAVRTEHLHAREDSFEPFHSLHEGYAVLLEEVEELKSLVFMPNSLKRQAHPGSVHTLVISECIQIATMAFCIATECESATPVELRTHRVDSELF